MDDDLLRGLQKRDALVLIVIAARRGVVTRGDLRRVLSGQRRVLLTLGRRLRRLEQRGLTVREGERGAARYRPTEPGRRAATLATLMFSLDGDPDEEMWKKR